MIFMGGMHKAYAASQINCCGAAAMIPGTVVNEVARSGLTDGNRVLMGHPAGIAEVEVAVDTRDGEIRFPRIAVYRTARRLLEGHAFVRRELFRGQAGIYT